MNENALDQEFVKRLKRDDDRFKSYQRIRIFTAVTFFVNAFGASYFARGSSWGSCLILAFMAIFMLIQMVINAIDYHGFSSKFQAYDKTWDDIMLLRNQHQILQGKSPSPDVLNNTTH